MSPHDFSVWLHGFCEITNNQRPTAAQWQIITDHLDLVFNKVTPERNPAKMEYPKVDTGPVTYCGQPDKGYIDFDLAGNSLYLMGAPKYNNINFYPGTSGDNKYVWLTIGNSGHWKENIRITC